LLSWAIAGGFLRDRNIAIIGAGPAGLGAAHRLAEIGVTGVRLYERENYAGGLAASFTDEAGFTWDVGGHVQFSHYQYFDRLMDDLLGEEWVHHERESWIWICGRFVPYPFQRNIHFLPKDLMRECLRGLIQAAAERERALPRTFADWIHANFGDGIGRIFLTPYNRKVWACDPSQMDCGWMGERVATVDLERVVMNIVDNRADVSWGPNNTFRFPLRGGTGEIWRRLAARLPAEVIHYDRRVERVEAKRKRIHFAGGDREDYDILISTMPMDSLVACSDLDELKPAAAGLRYSTTHIVGIGLKGAPPEHLKTKCWMYFPESNCPFYRVTVFSNYSPGNVPGPEGTPSRYWSLMVEVSESPAKPVDRGSVIDSAIDGALATGLIESKNQIVDTWRSVADHGYPTPFLGRDGVIDPLAAALEEHGIYSRGRFGAWKYEVSNQDHSLMQGVEIVNRLVLGEPEMTCRHPDIVNAGKR
jgi:protoporphyrinogen oxidase